MHTDGSNWPDNQIEDDFGPLVIDEPMNPVDYKPLDCKIIPIINEYNPPLNVAAR